MSPVLIVLSCLPYMYISETMHSDGNIVFFKNQKLNNHFMLGNGSDLSKNQATPPPPTPCKYLGLHHCTHTHMHVHIAILSPSYTQINNEHS